MYEGFKVDSCKLIESGPDWPSKDEVAKAIVPCSNLAASRRIEFISYIGHPMMGAETEFIWIQNNPRYSEIEFSSTKSYWKSRLWATIPSTIYRFEWLLGSISESSMGNQGSTTTWTNRFVSEPMAQGMSISLVLRWAACSGQLEKIGSISMQVRKCAVRGIPACCCSALSLLL